VPKPFTLTLIETVMERLLSHPGECLDVR